MELAGLSVAAAVEKEYTPETYRRLLVVCGPGNDGCVDAVDGVVRVAAVIRSSEACGALVVVVVVAAGGMDWLRRGT